MKIRVFEAFAGYGSQSIALQQLKEEYPGFDYEVVGFSEIDRFAVLAYYAARDPRLHGERADRINLNRGGVSANPGITRQIQKFRRHHEDRMGAASRLRFIYLFFPLSGYKQRGPSARTRGRFRLSLLPPLGVRKGYRGETPEIPVNGKRQGSDIPKAQGEF